MIILTGAAGFIGSHVAKRLADAGERLILVDLPEHFRNRGYFGPESVTLDHWAREKFPEERHKVVDRRYFPQVLAKLRAAAPAGEPTAKEHVLLPQGEKVSCVIHLGACTNTAETRMDFLQEWNVDYSKHLWNWCAEQGVPYIYASSGATYGNGENGFSDSWETALRLKPMNPYGQSKQDFDLWVHEQVRAGAKTPPHWYGLKFFNVYGSQEGHKGPMASPVFHSFRHVQRTGKCRLFRSANPAVKDGEQKRDFIHVDDIVEIVDFMRVNQPESGLYNCGTGQARTFYAMMEALFSALGKKMDVEWVETPEQFRKAYQYFTEADVTHLRRAGFKKPFRSLEDGVTHYVSWLLAHEARPTTLPPNYN